jgi:transposase
MGRRPEVFVRPLSMAEGQRLQRIGRTAKDPVRLRRAIVVLMSAQGQSVPDIVHLLDCSPEYARGVIHDFNDIGFKALDPKWSGGRPKTISERARRRICLIARCCPRDLGLPFSVWSLSKLAAHLVAVGVVTSISRETARQILRDGGISWQATKTWKASSDPDFVAKMHKVLDLYDHPPADGRAICADLCRCRDYAEARAGRAKSECYTTTATAPRRGQIKEQWGHLRVLRPSVCVAARNSCGWGVARSVSGAFVWQARRRAVLATLLGEDGRWCPHSVRSRCCRGC